ncbi:MAG TPA: CHAT domain-containing protein [Candidatus Methylomirabilis sp.]|nr:CHAT domain-containing protein [Candidatus Methylomirabilis sp.]
MNTPICTSRWSLNHSDLVLQVAFTSLLCLTALTSCATTEEQRFPLDYMSGIHAARQPATAREAFQAYQRMGADLERQGRFAQAAIAYSNASTSARSLRRLQDALEMSQKAVAMAERARDPRHLAPALVRLGMIHLDLNAPQRAIPILEKATQEARIAGNPNSEASGYISLSRAYRSIAKPDLAIEYTQEAVAVLEPAIARMRAQGQRFRGRRQEGLWNMERNYSTALLALGGHHLALHQLEPARAYFEKARESGERFDAPQVTAQAQLGLGRVDLEQRNPQAALVHLQESLRLSPQPNLAVATQSLLGRVYHETGNLPAAESHLRTSVAAIEDMRSQLQSEEFRETFVEDKMGAYARLIQVLFDRRKLAEAFDMSERARARAFLDLLGNRVSLSKGRSAALIAEEKSLQERIAQLKAREALQDSEEEEPEQTTRPGGSAPQRELNLAREAYAAFLSRVRAQSREQASLMTVEPLTLSEVQALLGPDTVLLEYFVGGGRTLGWVVSRDALRVVRLRIGENELARHISDFRQLIASRGRIEELQQAASDLFQTLVAPAFPAGLPRELLIVPHRALHYLPFHALMSAPGRHLVQDSLVYYLSSASLMQFTREKEQAATAGALAVGNPDLEDPGLNLRYAEREAREVGRFFPEATVLVGKEATKIQTRRYMDAESLIHLATHADLDGNDPLGSALLLRPAGGDTGRLEVQEVFGLDLHASLVILSACDTSLGRLTQGDEVVGLTRAFIYAGTPSVISTLWMVDDRASYELMQAFYQNLRAGRGKGEALRQAQLATLSRYPHPYYWAAYQLTGEAR